MRQIDRRCHWLGHNKSSKRPGALVFFDTEAIRQNPSERIEEHTFRLAVACYCRYSEQEGLQELDWRTFYDVRQFWQWVDAIATNVEDLTLVAHNIDYDARLSCAFSLLPRLGWSPDWCVMARSCSIFAFERINQKLTLVDNMNIWPVALADIGQSIGLPKLEIDLDTQDTQALVTYCKRDVEILVSIWRIWLLFLDTNNLGNFGITIAKQAFNAYRHQFMHEKIGIHNNALAIELERESYRGARCEPFFVGEPRPGTYYKLDVNGLYAFMMQNYLYPQKLVKVINNVRPDYLDTIMRDYLVIARVCIDTDLPRFPVKVRDRNAFPVGQYFTTLTTPELQTALYDGDVVGIGEVALYEPCDLFSDYIKWATNLRQSYKETGDVARSKMCKLLRNSLQGKFGQRGHEQEVIGEADIDEVSLRHWIDAETGQTATDITFGGVVIRQSTDGESYDSFPAIPAHVAAYGRVYMWSLMQMCGNGNYFYTDTDSLIVNQQGFDNLSSMIDNYKLGYLKVEGITTNLEINARKDYRFGQHTCIKGIKSDAIEVDQGRFQQWHFTTIKYAFAKRDLDGVTLHKVEKQLKRANVAGSITHDGWIKPIRLHLSPDNVYRHIGCNVNKNQWVWEFNQSWLDHLESVDSLNWRLAHSPGWTRNFGSDGLPFGRLV